MISTGFLYNKLYIHDIYGQTDSLSLTGTYFTLNIDQISRDHFSVKNHKQVVHLKRMCSDICMHKPETIARYMSTVMYRTIMCKRK